jgi:hypothetical protein
MVAFIFVLVFWVRFNLCRFCIIIVCLYLLLSLEIQLSVGDVSDPINQFKHATFIWLYQDFQRHILWSFCVQWFEIRGSCSFCWYWWYYWPSVFNLSFHNLELFRQCGIFCCSFYYKDVYWITSDLQTNQSVIISFIIGIQLWKQYLHDYILKFIFKKSLKISKW